MPLKDDRVCPFCGIYDADLENLRAHIEVIHFESLATLGKITVNRMVFWRSKRGVRRLSNTVVRRELKKAGFKKGSKTLSAALQLVRDLLKLCLVRISNDRLDPDHCDA